MTMSELNPLFVGGHGEIDGAVTTDGDDAVGTNRDPGFRPGPFDDLFEGAAIW